MGKAISHAVKVKARDIVEIFPDQFSKDFRKNKEFYNSLNLPFSKVTGNLICGMITRTFKKKEKENN